MRTVGGREGRIGSGSEIILRRQNLFQSSDEVATVQSIQIVLGIAYLAVELDFRV